jgi:hypothetical protein
MMSWRNPLHAHSVPCGRSVLPALAMLVGVGVPAVAQDTTPDPVGVSMYYECDMTREARADEIMLVEMAPIFQQHVESGELLSWVWLEHDLGGRWRRASAFYAADQETLFRVRAAILDELRSRKPEATAEFTDICHAHEDYVWIQRYRSP